jgi:hypothetical protein
MSRRGRLAVAAIVALAGVVGEAHAAPTKPRSRPVAPEAREDYEVARALFAKGDYKGCVEALERAQKAAPDPLLFWNTAACEKKLGHYAKAINYVERYLVASAGTLSEDEKKEATQFLEASRAYVARVTVTANVDGVQVFVDGDIVGTSPLEKPIVVDEGEHSVRYARSGYEEVMRNERAIGGTEMRWAVELAPRGAEHGAPVHAAPTTGKRPSRIGPILLGGAGAVAAGVGAFFAVRSTSEADTIEGECGTTCPPSRWEKYRDQQRVGDVLIGVGGALVVGAVVWWLVTPDKSEASLSHALARPVGGTF